MSNISFTKYVDITSAVGGGTAVRTRDLIIRIFTTNSLVPPNSYAEFETASAVSTYFGSTSEEYLRAAACFGFIGKNVSSPQKISYARYTPAAVAPMIHGDTSITQTLASWTAITNGSIQVSIGGVNLSLTGITFASATTLANVASTVQTAIRTGTGTVFTGATVTWNATRNSFDFVGGATGVNALVIAAGTTGTDVAALLGWTTAGAIVCDGADATSLTDTLTASAMASNNFASFLFIDTMTVAQATEIATWNDAQNVMFIYLQRVSSSTYSTFYAALQNLAGTVLTLDPGITGEYPDQFPGTVLAAIDYTKRNSTANWMYQQGSLTPSVTTDALSTIYDNNRINYYGRTQTAGQLLSFYQRGVMCGISTDPVDINTYSNELWFKDAVGAAYMSLLLSLNKISANANGKSQLLAQMMSVVNTALYNGTISVQKTLTSTQKLYIANLTGSDTAYLQVYTKGYWLDGDFESYTTTDGRTEWKWVYTFIYAKDDCIRKVEGSHVLI